MTTVRFHGTVSIREADRALAAMESEGRGTYHHIRMTSSGLVADVECDDPSAIPGVAEVVG